MSAPTDPCFMSAVAQRRLLDAGGISALELLDAHIDRIERYDGTLNAIVTRCFEQARETAAMLSPGALRGPLVGLPIAHKERTRSSGTRRLAEP